MRVKVRLFAQLRDLAGGGDFDCAVEAPASVQDVWRAIVRDHPALASFTRAMSTAVNLEYVRPDTPVRDGDEVAFLPPVSGG
jgi:molybdopterin converting factor subunit 1